MWRVSQVFDETRVDLRGSRSDRRDMRIAVGKASGVWQPRLGLSVFWEESRAEPHALQGQVLAAPMGQVMELRAPGRPLEEVTRAVLLGHSPRWPRPPGDTGQ